jgi:transposase
MNRPVPPARTPLERELERIQIRVTQGELAERRRRELIAQLYESGMSQVEIAARLTRAARRAGGEDVGEDAVQKNYRKWRMKGAA